MADKYKKGVESIGNQRNVKQNNGFLAPHVSTMKNSNTQCCQKYGESGTTFLKENYVNYSRCQQSTRCVIFGH